MIYPGRARTDILDSFNTGVRACALMVDGTLPLNRSGVNKKRVRTNEGKQIKSIVQRATSRIQVLPEQRLDAACKQRKETFLFIEHESRAGQVLLRGWEWAEKKWRNTLIQMLKMKKKI